MKSKVLFLDTHTHTHAVVKYISAHYLSQEKILVVKKKNKCLLFSEIEEIGNINGTEKKSKNELPISLEDNE